MEAYPAHLHPQARIGALAARGRCTPTSNLSPVLGMRARALLRLLLQHCSNATHKGRPCPVSSGDDSPGRQALLAAQVLQLRLVGTQNGLAVKGAATAVDGVPGRHLQRSSQPRAGDGRRAAWGRLCLGPGAAKWLAGTWSQQAGQQHGRQQKWGVRATCMSWPQGGEAASVQGPTPTTIWCVRRLASSSPLLCSTQQDSRFRALGLPTARMMMAYGAGRGGVWRGVAGRGGAGRGGAGRGGAGQQSRRVGSGGRSKGVGMPAS